MLLHFFFWNRFFYILEFSGTGIFRGPTSRALYPPKTSVATDEGIHPFRNFLLIKGKTKKAYTQ